VEIDVPQAIPPVISISEIPLRGHDEQSEPSAVLVGAVL
jgi:hypothetical protein